MIICEKKEEIKRAAEDFYSQKPDWETFFREILGSNGIVRQTYTTPKALAAFEKSDAYQEILEMLNKLRQRKPLSPGEAEPNRVITVRMPKSLHEALKEEAHNRRTSMNKLCITQLFQLIERESSSSD